MHRSDKTIFIALPYAVSAAIAVALLSSPSASATIIHFNLHNHPDGVGGNYGLRLDGPSPGDINTFGFDDVRATLDTDTGVFTIFGDVTHLQTGDAYALDAVILVDSSIDEVALYNPDATFARLTARTDSLTLTGMGGFAPTDWQGFGMGADPTLENFFIDSNFRNVGPDTLSGWGWLAPVDDYPNAHIDFQDWLFTMDAVVPEPATATLVACGLLALGTRRVCRRRR